MRDFLYECAIGAMVEMTEPAQKIVTMFRDASRVWLAELNEIMGGGFRKKEAMPGGKHVTYWAFREGRSLRDGSSVAPMLLSIDVSEDADNDGVFDVAIQLVEPKRRSVVLSSTITGVSEEELEDAQRLLSGFRRQYERYAANGSRGMAA